MKPTPKVFQCTNKLNQRAQFRWVQAPIIPWYYRLWFWLRRHIRPR